MKKIYYLLLTLAISSLSFGQVEVFNLAGGGVFPDGWTATNNVATNDIDKGSYFLLDSGGPSDIIVSAVYDLSAYSSAEFSLDVATFGSGDNNSATIEFSYDGGTTYTSPGTTAVPTSSSYIAGGTFTVTPSAQVVIKLTNTGVAGRGNRLRNLILTGVSSPSAPVTNAPTPDAREAGDVISIYSDAYSNITVSDFNPNWSQTGFTTVDIAYDPTGEGNNTVLAYTNFNYQGTEFGAQDASSMEYLHVDVWTATAGAVLQVTPINNGTGAAEVLTTVTLVDAGWSSVDLPKASFTGMIWDSVLQLKFDGQTGTTPSDVYIDNIYFWKAAVAPLTAPVTNAPTPDAREAGDVISIYSDAYSNITVSDFNPNWSQTGFTTVDIAYDPTGEGNNTVLAYTNFNYQGTEFGAQDASSMEYLHVDVWTATAGAVLQVTPINNGTGAAEVLTTVTLVDAGWSSVDLPKASFTGMIWDSVLQLKFDGQTGTTPSDVYIDNIYFWKAAVAPLTAPVTNAPTPDAREAGDVISIYSDAYSNITVSDFNPNWSQTGFTTVDIAYDPTGEGNNTVLAYTNFNYQGTEFGAQDASSMEYLHVDVWTATAGAVLQVTPINNGTGAAEVLTTVTLVDAGWSSVDLPKASFTGMIWDSVLQLKFDGQTGTTPSDVYIDNIYFWKTAVAPLTAPVTNAPTPDAREAGDVISIYSDAYSNITVSDFNPNWSQTGFTTVDIAYDPTGEGNNTVLAYTNFNYQGTEFGAQDASSMEYLHVDVWTATAGAVLQVTPINNGTGAAEVLTTVTLVDAGWSSVDLPKASFTGMIWDSVLQLKFDGQTGTTPSDVYIDNIYFWKTAVAPLTAPVTNAPTPDAREAGDVISIYSDAYSNITVSDFNPNWSQTGFTTVDIAYDPTGEGNNTVLAYTNFNYQGTEFGAQDASSMEYLHVDVWTATAGAVLQVTPINNGTGAAEVLTTVTLVDAGWSSVDLPKASFTGMIWDSVLQLKFDGQTGTTPSDVYIDNIYFWKTADTTAPVIELIGANPQELAVGDAYVELNATATDDTDDDTALSAAIVIDATAVDTATAGSYSVTYNVSDAAGNAATEVVRTVTVEAATICTSSEGFETFPLVDWTLSSSNTPNSVTQSASWANSGTNSLRFSSYSNSGGSPYDQHAVTPQLVTTDGDQTISFYYRSSNGSEVFKVGTSSTGSDVATDFTWSDEIVSSSTAAQYSISDLPVGTTYVAIHYYSNYQYYMYVDDFCMPALYVPDCVAPTALVAANLTTTTADISWTSDGTTFNVEYGTSGFTLGTGTTSVVSTNAAALTALATNTSYDVYVQNDCGTSGMSTWTDLITFTTLCDAVTTFPWTEDFEGITTPSLPSCWSENDNNADTDYWKTYDTYGVASSNAAGMYTDYNIDGSWSGPGTNNDDYLILPQFALTGNERLKFSVRSRSSGEPNDYKVVLSTSSNDPTDFTTDLMALTVSTATHTEQVIDLSAYSGNVYIAIHVPADGLDGYYLYVDDFTVEALPSCLEVTDLAVTNLTNISADLSWTAGATETAWNIEYGATDFTLGAGTTVAVTANSYALMGLTANTSYDFYVQSDCGANGTSVMVGPFTFATPCSAFTVPYFEGFETGYTHAMPVDGCLVQESSIGTAVWNANNTYTSYNRTPRTGDWNAYVGYNNTDWLFVYIDLIADTSYTASVYARQDGSTATNSDITISYGTSAEASAMTNSIVPATGIINGDYQLISGAFTPATSGTFVIGIKGYMNGSPWNISLDDISIDLSPSCLAVTGLSASNLTTTSADLSWTAGATETAWNLEYGATGFVQGAGTTVAVTANSYALTGLAANTSYDVYVQADCGAGDTSTWVGPITIFTGYCVPSSSSSSTFIDSVTSTGAFSDLNNGADGYSETGYANYFSTYAIQSLAGASFDLTATIVGGTAGFAVWIDYNNDLTFDSTEVVFNTTSYANGPFTATIALPETLADGDYRMRLMVDYNDSNPNDDACAFNGTRAEAEDYKITIDSSLGMDTVSKSNFTYFPNPVNNVLSIKAQASIDSITVYNMLGQTVVRSTPNTTTTTVDMSGLQTGAYFVQVAINNSIETVRVIKN